ncbi:MAG: structural protein P5 [Prevotellaceae bacterium]|nr:structural protein P5 [Candidatus Faecinaster equi]
MNTRGFRNNNPLNIRFNKANHWIGEIRLFKKDKDFCEFQNCGYGYRAARIVLENYIKKGFNTIDKMIARFAPNNENDTKAYADYVYTYSMQKMNYARGYVFGVDKQRDTMILKEVIAQMSHYESSFVDRTFLEIAFNDNCLEILKDLK